MSRPTPLDALHRALGARMADFAGWSLPLHYAPGILAEHLHTRAAASLFDVSHMGQIALPLADAAGLEALVPADIVGLTAGRQRYAMFTNGAGGVLDDLMVANLGDELLLVVNAAGRDAGLTHLRTAGLAAEARFDRALLALQGPGAEAALTALAPAAAAMRFMDAAPIDVVGLACTVSRSGYTGEDGYEIGCASADALPLARALLARPGVAPAGLGARDSLRLEAGLCLYGHDLGPDTSPIEAALGWAIPRVRRPGGARGGGYPGADRIAHELGHGPPRLRIGLRPEGRAPVRPPASLFASDTALDPIGHVTSGGFGPSVGAPVAMAYVAAAHATPGATLWAEVRGRRLAATVAALPFTPPGFKR